MNFENIHKLITKEDNSHIHKIFGTISLCNYIYRFGLLFLYGNMYLKSPYSLYLILLHGILSISSLIFHIPKIRNPGSPMIYPEFRLHSIVFALRSVLCCILAYNNFHPIFKIFICILTIISADIITYYYKDGSTMRNMPFNENITKHDQNMITNMYSNSQISATLFMLGNMTTAFTPMFAIQIAAFLMTLVRKNIIKANTWHIVYALSLWINIFSYITIDKAWIIMKLFSYMLFKIMRFHYKMNKYLAWSIVFILYIMIEDYGIRDNINYFIYINSTDTIFNTGIIVFYLISSFIIAKSLFFIK